MAENDKTENKAYTVSSAPSRSRPGAHFSAALSASRGRLTENVKGYGDRAWQASGLNRRLAAAALVLVLLCTGGGYLGASLGANHSNEATTSLTSQKKIITNESQLINSIASSIGESVVSVNVTSQSDTSTDPFFGFGGSQTQQSAGTGIIISSDGLVLTNRHVVPAGTTKVSVTLSDGTELDDVTVVGRTRASDTLDVAFLKINDTKGHKLVAAAMGDSSTVKVGDTVVAIGNALGQFQNTVTSGIISGYGRSVEAASSGSLSSDSETLEDLFQTDAAINEGNSGGPLVNTNGQVIGINTAIASDAQNVGFAIPINDVAGLIKQVKDTGKFERPYLGVHYVTLTDDYAYQYNLSVKRGAYIPTADQLGEAAVVSGSPADKAGLKEKDIITQVDGTNINENRSLTSLLGQHQPGDTVNLTVLRGGKDIHVSVELGTAPADS